MKVENKVILVTGGGNGIGRELALHLLARCAKVAAVDIDQAALQATVELAEIKKPTCPPTSWTLLTKKPWKRCPSR